MSQAVYVAATRFGMGMGQREASLSDGNAMQWLWNQVQQPESTSDFSRLSSSQENAATLLRARKSGDKDAAKEVRRGLKDVFIDEMRVRVSHAITTPTPFYERLVDFWSNHFTVSIQKGAVAGIALAYEREAIRPHVTGRFEDMLLAVAHHPAMLIYLDNAQSIGPDSMAGKRSGKGLNENLAREIMELHTLGVHAGYTQGDVTNFAKVLTGWSLGPVESDNVGGFFFAPRRHESSNQTIFGKIYPDAGEAQGVAVLKDFATHPATAQHIAFKLARHFIADEPPATVVKALADTFLQSGGDLKSVYRVLLMSSDAWSLANIKIKNSYDLVISAARLCAEDGEVDIPWCLQSLRFLGDVPFNATSPAGLPDIAKDIAGPEAVLRRVEWAQGAANKLLGKQSYVNLANLAIGPILSSATREALSSAHDQHQGLALLFGSPEFQRR